MAVLHQKPQRTFDSPESAREGANQNKFVYTVGLYWSVFKETVSSFGIFLANRKFNGAVDGLKASLAHTSKSCELASVFDEWEATKNSAPPALNANMWADALRSIVAATKTEKASILNEVNTLGKELSWAFDLEKLGPQGQGLDSLVSDYRISLYQYPDLAHHRKRHFIGETMPKLSAALKKLHVLKVGAMEKAKASANAGKRVIEAAAVVCQSPAYAADPGVKAFCDHQLRELGDEFSKGLERSAEDATLSLKGFTQNVSTLGELVSSKIEALISEAKQSAEKLKPGTAARPVIVLARHRPTKAPDTPLGRSQSSTGILGPKSSNRDGGPM